MNYSVPDDTPFSVQKASINNKAPSTSQNFLRRDHRQKQVLPYTDLCNTSEGRVNIPESHILQDPEHEMHEQGQTQNPKYTHQSQAQEKAQKSQHHQMQHQDITTDTRRFLTKGPVLCDHASQLNLVSLM